MIADIGKIQKSLIFHSMILTIPGQVTKLNSCRAIRVDVSGFATWNAVLKFSDVSVDSLTNFGQQGDSVKRVREDN